MGAFSARSEPDEKLNRARRFLAILTAGVVVATGVVTPFAATEAAHAVSVTPEELPYSWSWPEGDTGWHADEVLVYTASPEWDVFTYDADLYSATPEGDLPDYGVQAEVWSTSTSPELLASSSLSRGAECRHTGSCHKFRRIALC